MDTNEIVIKKMQRYCAAMVSIFSENAFVSRASRRECIRIFKLLRSVKDVLTTWDRDCFRSDVLLRRRILPGCSASRHRHKRYRWRSPYLLERRPQPNNVPHAYLTGAQLTSVQATRSRLSQGRNSETFHLAERLSV